MLKLLPVLALAAMVVVSGCVGQEQAPGAGQLTDSEAEQALEQEIGELDEGTQDFDPELLGEF